MQSHSYPNYEEYFKNLNLCIVMNDPYMIDLSSGLLNTKTYPNYKQHSQFINCAPKPKTEEELNNIIDKIENASQKVDKSERIRNMLKNLTTK